MIEDGAISILDPFGQAQGRLPFSIFNRPINICNHSARIPTLSPNDLATKATPEDMLRARGTLAPWLASVTFGGPDLKTVYLGSLMGTTIPSFRSPVAGLPMVHWNGTR
jgi:hypothetical protein